jgi:tRNA(fMet)-specific endonuclease VapC
MYVLDTNTLIYFFRGQGRVADNLLSTPPNDVAIPAIAVYELGVGIAKSTEPAKRRRQFDELLDALRVLPFDRAAADEVASIRAALD